MVKKTKKQGMLLAIAAIALMALAATVFAACGLFEPAVASEKPKEAPKLKIGSIGPGGGKIFYISEEGFTVEMVDPSQSYTAHYLEAAIGIEKGGISTQWASQRHDSTNIKGTAAAIGTGRKNTGIILAADPDAPAAKWCDAFSNNGFDDWFLPSSNEVREMYNNSRELDLGHYSAIWTSTQENNDNAYYFNFMTGRPQGYENVTINKNKRASRTAWPVRAF